MLKFTILYLNQFAGLMYYSTHTKFIRLQVYYYASQVKMEFIAELYRSYSIKTNSLVSKYLLRRSSVTLILCTFPTTKIVTNVVNLKSMDEFFLVNIVTKFAQQFCIKINYTIFKIRTTCIHYLNCLLIAFSLMSTQIVQIPPGAG